MHCFRLSALISILLFQAIPTLALLPGLSGLPVDTSALSGLTNGASSPLSGASSPLSGGSSPLQKLNSLPLSMPNLPGSAGGAGPLNSLTGATSKLGNLTGSRKVARAFGSAGTGVYGASNRKAVRALAKRRITETAIQQSPRHNSRKIRRPHFDN